MLNARLQRQVRSQDPLRVATHEYASEAKQTVDPPHLYWKKGFNCMPESFSQNKSERACALRKRAKRMFLATSEERVLRKREATQKYASEAKQTVDPPHLCKSIRWTLSIRVGINCLYTSKNGGQDPIRVATQ